MDFQDIPVYLDLVVTQEHLDLADIQGLVAFRVILAYQDSLVTQVLLDFLVIQEFLDLVVILE